MDSKHSSFNGSKIVGTDFKPRHKLKKTKVEYRPCVTIPGPVYEKQLKEEAKNET